MAVNKTSKDEHSSKVGGGRWGRRGGGGVGRGGRASAVLAVYKPVIAESSH